MDSFVMNPLDECGLLTNSDNLITDGEIDCFGNGQGQVDFDVGLSLLLDVVPCMAGVVWQREFRSDRFWFGSGVTDRNAH
jgi:hypothetical protein